MSSVREEVLKHNGLVRFCEGGLKKNKLGCIFCYKRFERCKCTKRENLQQLTMDTKSTCIRCGVFLVNGKKSCGDNSSDLFNRENMLSDCRKLELSGKLTLTRNRIEVAIQSRLDLENGLVKRTEIDSLNNQSTTGSRASKIEQEPGTMVYVKRRNKSISDDLLKHRVKR